MAGFSPRGEIRPRDSLAGFSPRGEIRPARGDFGSSPPVCNSEGSNFLLNLFFKRPPDLERGLTGLSEAVDFFLDNTPTSRAESKE